MMIKRVFSVILCVVLLVSTFAISASAETINRVDTKVTDVKIYVETEKVEKGDIVIVTIYAENITAKNGILSVDFPLTYDKSKLSFVKLDCYYPASWGLYGAFFGHATPDEEPWYLRSLPDAGDLAENPAYMVKDSKQIGYKLTFKAVADGDAFVAVEDVGNHKIMVASIEGDDVVNYGANGMKVSIKIGGHEDNSSSEPDVSDDPSEAPSEEPSEDSGDLSSEEPSAEDPSSEDVSSAEDSSESVSEETSVENETSDVATSEEDSSATSSEEAAASTDDKADDDEGGVPPVLIVVIAVVAVAALLGLGGYFFMKNKTVEAE